MVKTEKKKRQHALFFRLLKEMPGYNEAFKETIKEGLVYQFSKHRTTSLSEMYRKYPAEYCEMIEAMKGSPEQKAMRRDDAADLWRKRVIAVIARFLDRQRLSFKSREDKTAYILRLACRAANCPEFNRIPLARLASLYNYFCERNRVELPPAPEQDYKILQN